MHIEFVEISNFRKLRAVHIAIADETTLFVGANNSGKTSAMVALGHFLVDYRRFSKNDFTASRWQAINDIGVRLTSGVDPAPSGDDWAKLLPTLDVWLHVEEDEFHRVSKLIPTLDWGGGRLGVRLRLEPTDLEKVHRDYITSAKDAQSVRDGDSEYGPLKLWPDSMMDFLTRGLSTHLSVRGYVLDPGMLESPHRGVARPQQLADDAEPVDGVPLAGLIRVDEINAQRGLGHQSNRVDMGEDRGRVEGHRLSRQLHSYYRRHLDPAKNPAPSDLAALSAIDKAQVMFDERLGNSFRAALDEVQQLGYPGVTDPKLRISTRIQPVEGLDHESAVQYELPTTPDMDGAVPLLPEHYNGLGYQNLISMVFRLMSFRDSWMRVGKANKDLGEQGASIEPIHLVLVEEPEAHLHAQVQQAFVRNAYDVLRNHLKLKKSRTHTTQVLLSTHSSHVAHEVPYASLRYFRRMPANGGHSVPFSTVVNLSTVFGGGDDTTRFVTRYLRTHHCDLFFADAAILVEGAAERVLVPHFMRQPDHSDLTHAYITLLEIGGSHAFRLQPLIEALGLLTLVITDIDAGEGSPAKKKPPARGRGQVTTNSTLKNWIPGLTKIDDLLSANDDDKVLGPFDDDLFAVRVAYQSPTSVGGPPDATTEMLPCTFEDALAVENPDFFADKNLDGGTLIKGFRREIAKFCKEMNAGGNPQPADLIEALYEELRKGNKAEFALDVLAGSSNEQLRSLKAPTYIAEGLTWLKDRLKSSRRDVSITDATTSGGA